jgi:hypothetical protein
MAARFDMPDTLEAAADIKQPGTILHLKRRGVIQDVEWYGARSR